MRELAALRAMVVRTKGTVADLRILIGISPEARQDMQDYVAHCRAHGEDASWVLVAIRRRDVMLELLDREEAHVRLDTAA